MYSSGTISSKLYWNWARGSQTEFKEGKGYVENFQIPAEKSYAEQKKGAPKFAPGL